MSDLNSIEPNNPALAAAPKSIWRRSRNLMLASVLVLGGGLAGAVATGGVYAQGMGPVFGMGHGGPGMHFGRQLDPAQIEARADRRVRHLAVEIDATNEQTEKLRNIVRGAVKDLIPLRAQIRDAREKAQALLVQPNLTRNDIEAFRAQQLALADQASKRITQALGDASDVVTAEQRKKLGELIEHRRESRGWWHRGRDRG